MPVNAEASSKLQKYEHVYFFRIALADYVYVAFVIILLLRLSHQNVFKLRMNLQGNTGFTNNLGLHGAGS